MASYKVFKGGPCVRMEGMALTHSRIQAYGMLVISIAIILAFLYGIFTRPVIFYHLSTPIDYNGTVDLSAEILPVELNLRNTGFSPARVTLVVRLYNMSLHEAGSFVVEELEEFPVLRLPWSVSAKMSEYDTVDVAFEPAANSTYLVLIYSIEVDLKVGPISRFHNSFAINNPERPTALLMKHVSDEKYMRVRRR